MEADIESDEDGYENNPYLLFENYLCLYKFTLTVSAISEKDALQMKILLWMRLTTTQTMTRTLTTKLRYDFSYSSSFLNNNNKINKTHRIHRLLLLLQP